MKKVLLSFILFITLSNISSAQVGMYKTYQDYVEGNLLEYDKFVKLSFFTVYFTDEGGEEVKINIKKQKYWGMRTINKKGENETFRIDERGYPQVILIPGKITLFAKYGAVLLPNNDVFPDSTPVKIAKGPNGEMINFSIKNFKKFLADDPETLEKFEQVGRSGRKIVDFIKAYNDL